MKIPVIPGVREAKGEPIYMAIYYAISDGKINWFSSRDTDACAYQYYFVGWDSRSDYYKTAPGGYIPATHKFLSGADFPYMSGIYVYVYDTLEEAQQELKEIQREFYSELEIVPLELDMAERRLYPIEQPIELRNYM